jgi:hypothetical protein
MPVLTNPVNTRLEILKTIYKLSGKKPDLTIKLHPAQIDGGYYSEIKYQLRFLSERGLVDFKKSFIYGRFQVSLTAEGLQLMDDMYGALKLSEAEKEEQLNKCFAKLRT